MDFFLACRNTLYVFSLRCRCLPQSESITSTYMGYNHWASGQLEKMEVNTAHPLYCHIRAMLTPSMKPGNYKVFLLLQREGNVAQSILLRVNVLLSKPFHVWHIKNFFHYNLMCPRTGILLAVHMFQQCYTLWLQ